MKPSSLTIVVLLCWMNAGGATARAQNACCSDPTTCVPVGNEGECNGLAGVFLAGADCADSPCAPGACCTDVNCNQADAFSCVTNGRDFIGAGIPCSDDPCAIGSGACCMGERCAQMTDVACAKAGGSFVGFGTICGALPCQVGACCGTGTCSDLPQFECAAVGGTFTGTADCADNVCTVPPLCPEGSLFGQSPAAPAFFAAGLSDVDGAVQRWENYSGVTGAVTGLTWWGLDLKPMGNQFVECVEPDPEFQISLHENAAGVPGVAACSATVTATRTPLPLLYFGFQLNEYSVTLPAACAQPSGWVSIVGDRGDPECWFLWMSSDEGQNLSYCDNCESPDQGFDLSLCLAGTPGGVPGACCDQSTGGCSNGVDVASCAGVGQRFEADTDCVDLEPGCAAETGACCDPDGNCTIESPADCLAIQGTWLGADSPCELCPSMGACCVDNETCFITSESDCLSNGWTWVAQGSTCDQCPEPPDCPEGTLLSKPPDDPSGFLAGTSEASTQFQRYENYAGLTGAIEALTWWGFDLDSIEGTNNFTECVESDPSFDISVHEDAAGVPGAAVCSYTLTASSMTVGLSFGGAVLNEYTAVLPAPCVLVNGWISIVGLGDPDCWFLWQSTSVGDGMSYCSGCGSSVENEDLSMCLQGPGGGIFGACCNVTTAVCSDEIEISGCTGPDQEFTPDTLCDDLDPMCGVIEGACCRPDATCDVQVEETCLKTGGSWLGANSICESCPCIVPCPPDAIAEGEPTCAAEYIDRFNGGCDVETEAFSSIELCQTVCGEGGVFAVGPVTEGDSDWYEVTLERSTELRWRVEAEFPVAMGIVDGNFGCTDPDVLTSAAGEPCETVEVSAVVEAGTYWLVVGPLAADDTAVCGSGYRASLGGCPCPTDLNEDGTTDAADLAALLGAWGPNPGHPADLNADGGVNAADLAALLGAWGRCF